MTSTSNLEGDAESLLDTMLSLIKQTRVDPLFHISEIVQNEMDAGATEIRITFNQKGKGKSKKLASIVIEGNGFGFLESFERYHKNIANSVKKHLEDYTKRKDSGLSRGQFCLGLQGFRAICDEIQIINLTKPGMAPKTEKGMEYEDEFFPKMFKNRRLILWADNKKVVIEEENDFSEHRKDSGVTCILKGINYPIKAKDLVKYLSENKRSELIANKKLHIYIEDGKFKDEVKPLQYTGDVEEFVQSHPKEGKGVKYEGLGKVKATLYFHKPKQGSKIRLDVNGEPIVLSSGAGEFHPHALTEPDLNLSTHPALIVQSFVNCSSEQRE